MLRLPSLKALAAALFAAFAAASTGAPAGAQPAPGAPDPPAADAERARDIAGLVALYCAKDAVAAHEEPCLTAALVRRDIARMSLPAVIPGPKEYEARAAVDLAAWKDAGEALCEAKLPGCQRMAPILASAAEAMRDARAPSKALAIELVFADPRYNLDKTPAAGAALFRAASTLESMALFERAASLYERIATNTPEMKEAPAALERAMELRLLEGQVDEAKQRAASFEKAYGKAQPAALARALVHIASHDARVGAWRDVRARLSGAIARIDRSATIDVRILAHALLGRAAAELGDAKGASAEYQKVRRAWKDPEAGMKSIHVAFPDGTRAIARAVLVLNAVGEATFFAGEQRRAVVLRSPMPSYKGPDTREGIADHIHKVLVPWMQKKQKAIEEASDSYLPVLSIEPAAPPKWVIAAAARVGWMWADFIEELRSVPVPPEWRRRGPIPGRGGLTYEELRAAYAGSTSKTTDVMKERAKAAFLVCVQRASRDVYFDETARGCERWLAKRFPREHHALDEIHDAPSRLAPPFLARPAERSLP